MSHTTSSDAITLHHNRAEADPGLARTTGNLTHLRHTQDTPSYVPLRSRAHTAPLQEHSNNTHSSNNLTLYPHHSNLISQ